MSKWRKKPVVIEAYDFIDHDSACVPYWVVKALEDKTLVCNEDGFDYFVYTVKTLEGDHIYKPYEDILIKGVHGELYPCKRDIFFETYEEAEE